MDFRKLRKRIQEQPPEQLVPPNEDLAEPDGDAGNAGEPDLILVSTDADDEDMLLDAEDPTSSQSPDEYTGIAAAFLEAEPTLFSSGFEVLRFRLAHELFCVPLEQIAEIIKPREITPVPRTPDWLLGIVSLRGTMIPVIDTALRLKVRSAPVSTQRIIIIEHEGELCGLLVDEVQNVEIVSEDAIEPLPAALADRAGQFLEGLMRLEKHLIAMIDIEAILELEGSGRQ